MQRLTEIPYQDDSALVFEQLADRPWAAFLDSGRPHTAGGRYDILVADPMLTLTTRGAWTEIRGDGQVSLSPGDPFALLRTHLRPPMGSIGGLPFCGGAVGYFGYDLGRRIEGLPAIAADDAKTPDLALGLYDWALVVDHDERRSWLVAAGRDPRTAARWEALCAALSRPPPPRRRRAFQARGPIVASLDRARYAAAFARIAHYIREGDCYQVNLAIRFAALAAGDPWEGYLRLRALNPAPFAAYLGSPGVRVLCASPERFLWLRDGRVETRPIKGTRPRGVDAQEDAALARDLALSVKDRAENLMIVDLLRNDLGRVCRPGSVQVPGLFEVEPYATVQHLVSRVTGELAAGQDAASLLRACFPGGSITGAPKIRAMEIIEGLEGHRRGVYCGAIGYLGFDGAMDTNIAIRTLVYRGGEVHCWAGGGIVHDSRVAAEYAEVMAKVAPALRVLA